MSERSGVKRMRGEARRGLEALVPWDLGEATSCFCIGPKLCQELSFHYLAFLPAAAAQEAGLLLLKILFIVPF